MPVTRIHKVFFGVILLEAVLVAALGYFFPDRLADGFSWVVLPPLHAGFVAALYFFGVLFMLGCLTTNDWLDVRLAIPLAVIWTGLLFIVSIYHLDKFDWDKLPVKIWLIAYFLDPIFGLWLIWQRRDGWKFSPSSLPKWARGYLLIQAGIVIIGALVLLFLPATIAKAWPWKLDPVLAQFYAGPLLAYGLCSLLLAWQGTWSQLEVAAPAMLIFTATTLIASYKYRDLFSSGDTADVLWFGGMAVATVMHLVFTVRTVKAQKN